MYSLIRYAALIVVLLTLTTGCKTKPKLDKYILVVSTEDGTPLEGALVTPQAGGKNFETKYTGVDGQVDLRGIYSEMPTTIMVRGPRYKTKYVKWQLPSPTAQFVVLEKFQD